MTSPLHGGDQAFESLRAHTRFSESVAAEGACAPSAAGRAAPWAAPSYGGYFGGNFSESMLSTASFELGDTNAAFPSPSPELPTQLPTLRTSDAHCYFTDYSPAHGIDLSLNKTHSHTHGETLNDLALPFSASELASYVDHRKTGLADLSQDWITRAAGTLWETTAGVISKDTTQDLRLRTLRKYKSAWSHGKTLSFAKAFLRYLTTIRLDTRYLAFAIFLEMPKAVKVRKAVTSRIVTLEDIESVLAYIRRAAQTGAISKERMLQYSAFVIFGAYTGQRSNATTQKLTVGQFREALQQEKACIKVDASQDKIRFEHFVPLHSQVIEAIRPLLRDRSDDERMFKYASFLPWIKRQKIPMSRFRGLFVLGDLRKFAEQYGDAIGWDQSNRAYILTHGVSGVDWAHYKHPLPQKCL